MGNLRTFTGWRPSPPAEYQDKAITNSGETPDYEGVVFSDGTVAVRWLTAYRSHSVWASWDDFYQVHGHPEYGTRIEWADDDGDPPAEADRETVLRWVTGGKLDIAAARADLGLPPQQTPETGETPAGT